MATHSNIRCSALLAYATHVILLCSTSSCLQFSYPTFDKANRDDFSFSPGSGIANGSLQITPNTGDISHRSGRVLYARETLNLWNRERTALTSFTTEFILNIRPQNGTGEGMAFILTNKPALPSDSSGQWLGIVNNQTDGALANRIMAVEFDTRKSNKYDPDGNHIGIDFNGIKTLVPFRLSNLSIILSSGSDVRVTVQYDGTMMYIDAWQNRYHFEYSPLNIDLSKVLVENISVGFAASTGEFTELNQVKSWNFSTIGDGDDKQRSTGKLNLLLGVLIPLAIAGPILALYAWRRQTRQRRLAYHNLGYLSSMDMDVAVKRVSTSGNSRRGEQEFVAEVNTISKLSHRNLVKLIGWCHERGELLLVYEYFPMGSLDKLLYADARATASPPPDTTADLNWERRHRIICGVASALDYLHHGSSKRVLHRDVKASNVMLDAAYNAKLGDFGLARVVQRDGATHHSTQVVAGTRAYMAYETFFTGRASLDTDVYAFGVFVMEVVSGRRPSSSVSYPDDVDTEETTTTTTTTTSSRRGLGQAMYIVDWAWWLYGEGRALHAADAALNGEFDPAQVECAVRLALACCHPNPRERPSMKAVVQVLIGGAKAPEPPFQKPAFVWPPEGEQEDMELQLPHVGLLFTGGQYSSFCSMTSNSITGR